MGLPLLALQVVGLSFVLSCLYEAVMWLLFYRGGYLRQLRHLEVLGKRLDAAQADVAADPNSSSKKKAVQRLEREMRTFSLSLQGTKMKIGFVTAATMFGGMWLVNRHYRGIPVARMPFEPYSWFRNVTHMGLPGDDFTEVSAAFFYVVTTPLFRGNLAKLTGSAPGRAASKYLGSAGVVDAKKWA